MSSIENSNKIISRYLVPSTWIPEISEEHQSYYEGMDVYIFDDIAYGYKQVWFVWSDASTHFKNRSIVERKWNIKAQVSEFKAVKIPLPKKVSISDYLSKWKSGALVAIASLLIAFEAIYGRYEQLFTPVSLELFVEKPGMPFPFSDGENIILPIMLKNSSTKKKDRSVRIAKFQVASFVFDGDAYIEEVGYSLSLRKSDKSTVLWEGGKEKKIEVLGAAKEDVDHEPQGGRNKYRAHIALTPASCTFCYFQSQQFIVIDYETWEPFNFEFEPPTHCGGRTTCSFRGILNFGKEHKKGVKVSHSFRNLEVARYMNLGLGDASKINDVDSPHVDYIPKTSWEIKRPIKKFTTEKFAVIMESTDGTAFTLEQWKSVADELKNGTKLHRVN